MIKAISSTENKPDQIGDEASLASTRRSLQSLYEGAQRNNRADTAALMANMIFCCDEIMAGRPVVADEFESSLQCLNFIKSFLKLSKRGRLSFVNLIELFEEDGVPSTRNSIN